MAVREGFTTKSVATNAGVSLDYFLKAAVLKNGGHVTIFSERGIVRFGRSGTEVRPRVLLQEGFCPGANIAIDLRTDAIERLSDEPEDLRW